MSLEPKDRDIAMVFQSYGLYPNMTVKENIRFPLKIRKVDPATHEERVARAVAMVELEDFVDRQARGFVGRAAPAGGAGAGHRARAHRVPDGRTAVQSRRQAAGFDPCADQEPAA
jgi:hypothetical protein